MDFIKEFWFELLATLALVFLGFIIKYFRRNLVVKIARILLPELRQSSLVTTHASMQHALKNIKSAVRRTHDLKIISNKGTDWIGDDNAALSQLIGERALAGLMVRILLLSKNALWLNAAWAKNRGKPSIQFVRDEFETAHRLVESFMKKHNNLRHKSGVRYHEDDPIWRMVMTEDRLFASSYANLDQARDAIVFEFDGPSNEIYQAFKRYFNFLWDRRSATHSLVKEDAIGNGNFDTFEMSAGAVVYSKVADERKILLVERYDGLMTLPKGHVGKDEDLSEAAMREVQEETGLTANILRIDKVLGWYPNPIIIGNKTRILKVVYYYLLCCVCEKFPVLKSDADHKSANWYSTKDIANLRFAYSHVEQVIHNAFSVLE